MAIAPITPQQAEEQKPSTIPDDVFKVVNALLISKFNPRGIRLEQDEVAYLIVQELLTHWNGQKLSESQLIDNGWLDIEGAYERVGWRVEYFKPDRGESGGAGWMFTPPSKHPRKAPS